MIGRAYAGGVVNRVGVDATAGERVFDAAQLREAEVAAFGDGLAAQVSAVDAHGVVGAVADLGVPLQARLDVGSDAAVVEQIDRGLENRVDQFVGRHLVGLHA